MASQFGDRIKVQIFGQSHSKALGVVIDGIPAGKKLDLVRIQQFLDRRAGGKNAYSTKRKEADTPDILSGLIDGVTCGAPLCAVFANANMRPKDYSGTEALLRPSHADFTAWEKYKGFQDKSGGGQFSGRLTLPLCFAGAVCMQLLEQEGISVFSHILAIGDVKDKPFDAVNVKPFFYEKDEFPVCDKEIGEKMISYMEAVAEEGDSVGGIVECAVTGIPVGLGEPIYDNVESVLSHVLFGIPAVKGVEFGMGFEGVLKKGSQMNDSFYVDAASGKIATKTNHSGGIQGGITNGMPIVFRVALKPTPSIYKEQNTVDYKKMEDGVLQIEGRHDPCIVPRALPCVEAAAAVCMYDLLLQRK